MSSLFIWVTDATPSLYCFGYMPVFIILVQIQDIYSTLCPVYWYDMVGQKAMINMVIIRFHTSADHSLDKLEL